MRLKLYLLIIFLTFCISFSQSKPQDSLIKCNGILSDAILYTIQHAYQDRMNKPEETVQIFGCGTAAVQYLDELDCDTAGYILEKYPFILNEIKQLEKDNLNYSKLNVFWIEKIEKSEKNNIFKLKKDDHKKLEKWKSQKNHNYFSAVIISNKRDSNNENVQIAISLPKKTITKQYTLSYTKRWDYKQN